MTMSMTRRVGSKAKTRESTNELYLKSEQLLRFRIAFALVSLILCVGIGTFAGDEFEFRSTAAIVGGVSVYSFIGLAFIVRRLRYSAARLRAFNMIMITLDVISLTGLVHFTRGIESDLYVLYMLPILLSSYTFGKKGIYFSALLVTVSYIGLLVSENAELLPYVFNRDTERGLAAAYSDKLWRRILARAFFFASVSMLWARFCDYMSRVARQGAERLLEQLDANERLISDSDERAKRERLINSINKGVRSTLELDKIFETAVVQLAQAVQTDLVALICPAQVKIAAGLPVKNSSPTASGSWSAYAPVVVEETREHNSGPVLSADIAQFILDYKGNYERDSGGAKVKTFLFHDPAEEPFFAPIAADIKALGFKTLVIQPMMYGDESRGVFMLADKSPTRTFTESDVVLTKVVAGQVAVAVEHANLVSQLSRKNKDLVTKNLNLDSKNIELKTMQSQLIHQEKMASLGRLVAGIAHELNNPINFVHGNLPYLKQYVEELKKVISAIDELPAEQRKPVDDLKNKLKYDFLVSDLDNIIADLNEGAERIRHIIRDLKSFSRLDEAELKEASIQEGLESTMKILSQYYGRDKIPVEADYAQIPPVLCYPGQLNQVWMNLLSNAAQAMNTAAESLPAGTPTPALKIRTELSDQTNQTSGSVLVSITDCGGGIKEEVRSKIFDPFFTTKAVGQGTGLGLSICHSIIERHGGQIWFDSVTGQGTTFYVRLPLQAITKQLAESLSEPD
jgi:signal transduction histidine kinase